MPINKAIVTPSGPTASYWCIYLAEYNSSTKCLYVTMAGYVDQASFEGGMTPLETKRYEFNQGDSATAIANSVGLLTAIDEILLNNADFTGGTQV